jgi:hypothetical protein
MMWSFALSDPVVYRRPCSSPASVWRASNGSTSRGAPAGLPSSRIWWAPARLPWDAHGRAAAARVSPSSHRSFTSQQCFVSQIPSPIDIHPHYTLWLNRLTWQPLCCLRLVRDQRLEAYQNFDTRTLKKIQLFLFHVLLWRIIMYSLTCSWCEKFQRSNITALLTPKLSTFCLDEPSQYVETIPVRLEIDVIWLAVPLCLSSLDARRSQHTMIRCNPH